MAHPKELIEAVAIALGEQCSPEYCATIMPELREDAERMLDAHTAYMEGKGLVEVPMSPNEAMVVAGVQVMAAAAPHGENASAVIYGQPKDVYNAMIAAAQKVEG